MLNSNNAAKTSSRRHTVSRQEQQLIQSSLLNDTSFNEAEFTEAGLNQATFHKTTLHNDDTPWYISVMLGICGLLAGSFLTGFISIILSSRLEETVVQLAVGVPLVITALLLFNVRRSRTNTFLTSLAFALSMAGQAFLLWALFEARLGEPLDIWLLLLLQALMTLIMPNFIHRLISSLVVLGCVVYLLQYYNAAEVSAGLLALVFAVSSLQRYELVAYYPTLAASTTASGGLHPLTRSQAALLQIFRAVTYASALMLLFISVLFIMAEYSQGFGGTDQYYSYLLAQGLLILAGLYSAYLILRRYQISIFSASGLLIAATIIGLGVLSIYVSGLLATSLVIIIAMANSQRVLLGLGIIALVGYVFWYYYQLDTTLLVKSGSMLVVAIALLLVRWLLVNRHFARLTHSGEPKL